MIIEGPCWSGFEADQKSLQILTKRDLRTKTSYPLLPQTSLHNKHYYLGKNYVDYKRISQFIDYISTILRVQIG